MRLSQILTPEGERRVAVTLDDGRVRLVPGTATTLELAQAAILAGGNLAKELEARLARAPAMPVDLAAAAAEGHVLSPIDHADPAHLIVTGTGLTHLGSAESRDKMHKDMADPAKQTDSMRMFRLGLEGGKPAEGSIGVQPEWFYKGDGTILVPPGRPLTMPDFALDGGEEAEIVGIYLVGPDGTPWRLGFALGNEFSDHVMERQNYLYLAHSKLRVCSCGPELLLGPLPSDLRGAIRLKRGEQSLWEGTLISGEANMSHSIANLEAHHFKYAMFRRPGDIHVHFFGATALSFTAGAHAQAGDVFEIESPPFGLPLRNPLAVAPPGPRGARSL